MHQANRKPIGLENTLKTRVGKNVKRIRERKHYSQEDLAFLLDCHREYISKIERGIVNSRLSSLEKVASGLGVDLNDLIYGDYEK